MCFTPILLVTQYSSPPQYGMTVVAVMYFQPRRKVILGLDYWVFKISCPVTISLQLHSANVTMDSSY